MDYFYTAPAQISGDIVEIDGDEFKHLAQVMRKKSGDTIRVVDGKGNAYDVVLEELNKKSAHGRVTAHYKNHNEDVYRVTLAVGLLKNPSKFDFLVEKSVELGVHEIIPLKTSRVIAGHAKAERWQHLALAAMKQCGRSYLPIVRELQNFETLVKSSGVYDRNLICHETKLDISVLPEKKGMAGTTLLCIGPEGGFTPEEISLATSHGFTPLYLGPRRLRTETAAIAALAMLG
jgi:16S rRNA (uracil1498-N3)-methyltransferase